MPPLVLTPDLPATPLLQSSSTQTRFWFRYAIVGVAERLRVDPPLFRPRLPEWEAWLWEHKRTRELHSRIETLHKVGVGGNGGGAQAHAGAALAH